MIGDALEMDFTVGVNLQAREAADNDHHNNKKNTNKNKNKSKSKNKKKKNNKNKNNDNNINMFNASDPKPLGVLGGIVVPSVKRGAMFGGK